MSTTNILDLNNRIDALEKAVSGGDSAQANKKDIATEFNTTTNYTAGCFVYYKGKLYQFNADHSAGAWDPTDVVEANVTDQIVSNKAAIDGLTASDIAYDNTDSGMTATNVQGAVDELEARVDLHGFNGQYVTFETYTDVANPFIAPADGYARVANGTLRLGTTSANIALIGVDANNTTSVFVKKGTPLYVSAGTSAAYFIYLA